MGLSVKTLGCSGMCRSCYENRIRSVHKDATYNIEAILQAIEKGHKESPNSNTPCLHGGEPLIMKIEDTEKLLQKIHSLWGRTNIQTNGISITDEHIELFKKYKTSIGVSIDGDTWELNQGRWNAKKLSPEKIQEMTDKVLYNMQRVKEADLSLSAIVLLRRYNAIGNRLGGLIRFLLRLKDEFGIRSLRTNECIVYEDEYRDEEELTPEELGNAYCKIADIALSDPELQWLPYRDVIDLLMGHRDSTCIFTECDVWKTSSEQPIDKDGNIGNCLKGGGAIDGLQVIAADRYNNERYLILSQVPQELGGCKDCKYWHFCHGLCPGEGMNNDWRNKGRFCEAWKMLFSHIEKKLKGIMPNLYIASDFHPQKPNPSLILSSISNSTWRERNKKKIEEFRKSAKDEKSPSVDHGDRSHGDSNHGDSNHGDISHGDTKHGDAPHGDGGHMDTHGDNPHGDAPHGDR